MLADLRDDRVIELARTYGTPLYVFDETAIRQSCRELKRAVSYPHFHIRYACKALTLKAVLQVIRDEGLWIDASSLNEVHRALAAGFAPSQVYYTGEGATREVYRALIDKGVLINCTSIDQIRLVGAAKGKAPLDCSLRINPGRGHGESKKTNTGGPHSKHGIYFDQVDEAKAVAAGLGIRLIGVHSHIGSGTSLKEWLTIKNKTLEIARAFPDLTFVNLGGGLPVPYKKGDKPMPLKQWGARLSVSMRAFSREIGRDIDLYIEPGRYVVARSGFLIAEAQAVKQTPAHTFVIVNTGLNHNIRPAMYGAYHEIRFVRPDGRRAGRKRPHVIAGYLCESGDVFTVTANGTLAPRELPAVAVGDLMLMTHVGAYAHAMKSEYNSMDLPASVMLRPDGRVDLVERRGTLDDITRRERDAEASGRRQR